MPEKVATVAAPKVVSAKCPTCGANLPVPPGIPQVVCRYCQNVIQVEHRKPPPELVMNPGMPSRTVYIDPNAASAVGKSIGCIILVSVLLPILIPICIFVIPWATRSIKGAVKPFPVACGLNEEVEVSGNYETTGPLVTSVASNCKLHIKNAKLKGGTLVKTEAFNMELTLENVTLETTDVAVHAGANLKVKLHGSTLTSTGVVFDGPDNMEMDVENTTIESKNATAVKGRYNLKVRMENGKIRGKKSGIDCDANMVLSMKKASEVTSSDGVGVKTTSSLKLEADGGKIDAPSGALVMTSSGDINATNFVLSSKDKTISATSSLKMEYEGGSITSSGDMAIDADSSTSFDLVNTKVQGATTAINCESSSKIRASKKTRIVGTSAYGVVTSSNTELNLADAALEGGSKAFKGTVNDKVKLAQGARLSGKKGGLEAEGNLEVEGAGATIEGGAGPAIQAAYGAKITFKQGALKGVPAVQFTSRPSPFDLEGTKVEGDQRLGR